MNDPLQEHQFESLLVLLSECQLNDAQASELGRLIELHPVLRSRYLEHCQMQALLRGR